ncbi:MAG: Fe-S cluster assembly protein SufD, partial [Bacteroidales bacterium]|nr:Fe-S cluster assembly protein SufD [Bacteroidales bacterium]
MFKTHEALIKRTCGPVMNTPRAVAMDAFTSLGFPTSRQEAYRDCDLGPALERDYGMNLQRLSIPV